MALTIEVITQDIVLATEWETFRYTEQIGQPDEMSVDAIGFTTNPLFTEPVQTLFTNPGNYFYAVAKLDGDVLFSGLIRGPIPMTKDAIGSMRYSLKADGWEFLMPRRLVGTPYTWSIPADADVVDGLPTPIWVDPRATAAPTPASIRSLFANYWNYPLIDTATFVTDILPAGASGDALTWSGSDLEGAISDLAAAGSAAAMWWFANDSPDPQSAVAPNLALHWGLVILPEAGEDDDGILLRGVELDDPPAGVAPYAISDTPDWTTSILPVSMTFVPDNTPRTDGVYVRGATGNTLDVLAAPPGWPVPYQIGEEHEGGTGWVGPTGGIWGEEYVDAPAAISAEERAAFGNATLASREIPTWTGTVVVSGYDGWHKGQAISVTDADYGFVARWFLIRAVSMTMKDPFAEDNEYTLTLGDTLAPSLGYALRRQRLSEQRKEVAPAMKFVPYVGDLQLDPGGEAPVTLQLATASGRALSIAGVGARWHLLVNGADLPDPTDTGELFWLTDATATTDEVGQVTARLHASDDATAADAANPWAEMLV